MRRGSKANGGFSGPRDEGTGRHGAAAGGDLSGAPRDGGALLRRGRDAADAPAPLAVRALRGARGADGDGDRRRLAHVRVRRRLRGARRDPAPDAGRRTDSDALGGDPGAAHGGVLRADVHGAAVERGGGRRLPRGVQRGVPAGWLVTIVTRAV